MNTHTDKALKLIIAERHARQMSYREFSECLGVHFQRVHQWECGKRELSDASILTLIKSEHQWVIDLAFRCLLIRYPVILQLLAVRAGQVTPNRP